MKRPVTRRIIDFRGRLRLLERFWAREAAKATLCPSRAPKRRRGGVVAPNVLVSGYSRRGNLMERPVMRRTIDSRGRLRLLGRFWARARPPKSPCCAQVGHRNGDGGVWQRPTSWFPVTAGEEI